MAQPGLFAAAAGLFVLGYAFKAYGWRQLFAHHERPEPLALAAANGGASLTAIALPGRFDDVVRIAIVRRFQGPAGVRALCLSLFLLGLIDTIALAPFAFATAVLPGQSTGVRLGLALVSAVGLGAGALVVVLPRIAANARLLRFRAGRWLAPRTMSLRSAAKAWALVSACWLVRAVALVILLGALGAGFSLTVALFFLCASSAASALPVGPGGAATQVGAGAAALVASGTGVSEALSVAVVIQTVAILVGAAILLCAAAWRARCVLASRSALVGLPPPT